MNDRGGDEGVESGEESGDESALRALTPPTYTKEEKRRIFRYVASLVVPQLRAFLRRKQIGVSGTKAELRKRLREKVASGAITYADLVELLDETEPWNKQHVFLFNGPPDGPGMWRDASKVKALLKEHKVSRFLNSRLPLILPDQLKLSSIAHDESRLRITAVERREGWERREEHDAHKKAKDGTDVVLRAYVHVVSRGLISFEWDFASNTAMLQITQLPSRQKYEDAFERFKKLVKKWFDFGGFSVVDLRKGIKAIHRAEKAGKGETKAHAYALLTTSGRKLIAQSRTAKQALLGAEPEIDEPLDKLSQKGVGHFGNVYFLPNALPGNPLKNKKHVVLLGDKGRINITTGSNQASVRYVLQRIRLACQ